MPAMAMLPLSGLSRDGRQAFEVVSYSFSVKGVCVCVCTFSHVWLFATPWTVAHQARLSIVFSRQENWSGLPFPTPESSQPRDQTHICSVSCTGGQILLSLHHLGRPTELLEQWKHLSIELRYRASAQCTNVTTIVIVITPSKILFI